MDIKNHTKPIREFAEKIIALMDELESKVEPDIEVGQYWEWNPDVGGGAFRIRDIDHGTEYWQGTVFYDYLNPKRSVTGSGRTGTKYLAENARLLSDSEVEKILIEEAESKYEIGQRVRCLHDNQVHRIESFDHHTAIDVETESMWAISESGVGIKFYSKGDWAEVIEDEWEIEETPYLRIRKGGLVINCEHETEPEEGFERKEAEAISDALNDLEQS